MLIGPRQKPVLRVRARSLRGLGATVDELIGPSLDAAISRYLTAPAFAPAFPCDPNRYLDCKQSNGRLYSVDGRVASGTFGTPAAVEPFFYSSFRSLIDNGTIRLGDLSFLDYCQKLYTRAAMRGIRIPVPYADRGQLADSWLLSLGGGLTPDSPCISAHVEWFFYHLNAFDQRNADAYKAEYPNAPAARFNITTIQPGLTHNPYPYDGSRTYTMTTWESFKLIDAYDSSYFLPSLKLPLFYREGATQANAMGYQAGGSLRRATVRDLPWLLLNYPYLKTDCGSIDVAPTFGRVRSVLADVSGNELANPTQSTTGMVIVRPWVETASFCGYDISAAEIKQTAALVASTDSFVKALMKQDFVNAAITVITALATGIYDTFTWGDDWGRRYIAANQKATTLHAAWDDVLNKVAACKASGGTWNIDQCIKGVIETTDAKAIAACQAGGGTWDPTTRTCVAKKPGTLSSTTDASGSILPLVGAAAGFVAGNVPGAAIGAAIGAWLAKSGAAK